MNEDRPVLLVVLADVPELEPLRHRVVELDGAELPLAADRIGYVEIDLGPIERAIARLQLVLQAGLLEGGTKTRLRAIPQFVGADALRRPRRELGGKAEPERIVDPLDQGRQQRDL